MNDLDVQFRDLSYGNHLSFIYEDAEEQLAVIAPYIKVGLERGESCLYMTDLLTEEQVVDALGRYGVDVDSERARGALKILAAREGYIVDGVFDPDKMIAFFEATIDEVCWNGFTGFRVAAEMSWALSGDPGCELLASYESRVNEMFPDKRVTGLCQYHRPSFPAQAIRDVLRTHSKVIFDNRICDSLYFEPVDIFHDRCDEDRRVAWMLARTRDSHDARTARELVAFERAGRETAEASTRAKDQFLAMVSHELRTPLTSAVAAIWMLKQSELAPPAAEATAALTRSITSQIRLVDDLLDGARIEAGQLSLKVEPVDVRASAMSAVAALDSEARQKSLRLTSNIHQTPILVLADPVRIDQIITNLIENAIKFTPSGGHVDVTLTRDTHGITLQVRDDGAGMDPEFIACAFDKFTQAHGGSTRQYNGLGLGLAIVRQLVAMHGGTVTAESAGIGCGATFRVRLPFACKHPEASSVTTRRRPEGDASGEIDPVLQTLRVLVVDDDDDTCAILASILGSFVGEVRTASSANAAAAEASRFHPDVLVTDIAMPGQDGCALLERLRETSGTAAAIALTAHADAEAEGFFRDAGFDFYLRKPVDPMALVRMVAEAARLQA